MTQLITVLFVLGVVYILGRLLGELIIRSAPLMPDDYDLPVEEGRYLEWVSPCGKCDDRYRCFSKGASCLQEQDNWS